MPAIVGILNVTSDSYVDGGLYEDIPAAVARAGELLSEGADIIDVGGESTGPKSVDVSLTEEIRRVIPVIEAIKKTHPEAVLSIDTWKSDVAHAAISEGVSMVNDVTAGRGDPEMFSLIGRSQIADRRSPFLVLMYSKDPTPRTTIEPRRYDDVVKTVREFLEERIESALRAGIPQDRLIIDPGLGHYLSSDPRYSFMVLEHLSDFRDLAPIYVSPSRKSFLAGTENLPVSERLPGTIAASAVAALHGATYIRTHDPKEVRRGCEIAISTAQQPESN